MFNENNNNNNALTVGNFPHKTTNIINNYYGKYKMKIEDRIVMLRTWFTKMWGVVVQ